MKHLIKLIFDQDYKVINKVEKQVEEIFKIYNNKYKKSTKEEIKKTFKNTSKEKEKEIIALMIRGSELVLGLKPYKVQIIGVLLAKNKVIEMKTGEGKTLVGALLSIYLKKVGNNIIYNVSVNEYLVKRDSELNKTLFDFFDYTSGYVLETDTKEEKKEKYLKDIVYTTNNNLAFDFLKDQMVYRIEEKVVRELDVVIIDEIDSILVDEARTPLIISSEVKINKTMIRRAHNIAKTVDRKGLSIDKLSKKVSFKNAAIIEIEKKEGIKNLFDKNNYELAHRIIKALEAIYVYEKEKDYLIQDKEIKIIDQNTGRISEGVRWSDGLHNAIEEKEGVKVQESSETNAMITYQSFFNLFNYKTGMSGTVMTEKEEFKIMYDLEVIGLPTNKVIQRIDENDLLFGSEEEKMNTLISKVKENKREGLPTLIGTISIEQSEYIYEAMNKADIKEIKVLNAKNHKKEADIIKTAGEEGSVTIATNMAGRGVDIKIEEEILEKGGLQLIGFERYHNRRIDNQLMGRSGRQGNKGRSVFLLSITDDLLRFPEREEDMNAMQKMTKKTLADFEGGAQIDMLSNLVKKSQVTLEGQYYEQRKTLFKLDKSFSSYRNIFYNSRNVLMEKEITILKKDVKNKIKMEIEKIVKRNNQNQKMEIEKMINEITELGFVLSLETMMKLMNKINEKESLSQLLYTILKQQLNTNILKNEENLKTTYLFILDQEWKHFLYKSENIKKGIWFRQNTQKDPVHEYAKELEKYYTIMKEQINESLIRELILSISNDIYINVEGEGDNLKEIEKGILKIENTIEIFQDKSMKELEEMIEENILIFVEEFIKKNQKIMVNYIQNTVKGKGPFEHIIEEYNIMLKTNIEIEKIKNKSMEEIKDIFLRISVKKIKTKIKEINKNTLYETFIDAVEVGISEFNDKNIKDITKLEKMIWFTFLVFMTEVKVEEIEEKKESL